MNGLFHEFPPASYWRARPHAGIHGGDDAYQCSRQSSMNNNARGGMLSSPWYALTSRMACKSFASPVRSSSGFPPGQGVLPPDKAPPPDKDTRPDAEVRRFPLVCLSKVVVLRHMEAPPPGGRPEALGGRGGRPPGSADAFMSTRHCCSSILPS